MAKPKQVNPGDSTTTTTVPTTDTTVPKEIVTPDEDTSTGGNTLFTPSGTGFAGNYDPYWKAPDKTLLNDPTIPYIYRSQDYRIIFSIPESDIVGLQSRLSRMYPGWTPGIKGNRTDTKTVDKFKDLLVQINNQLNVPNSPIAGADWDKALDYFALNPIAGGTAGTQKPAIRLTNPIDLKSVFKKASTSTLGRALSDDEIMKLVTTYQGLETTYQQQASTGSGAVVTQAPDAGAFAEQQARKLAPEEATANDYTDYVGALSQLLQG